MQKSMIIAFLCVLPPCVAQVTGGRETVQDAIRFERHKDAAAARQARIERQQPENASANRSAERPRATQKPKAKRGSAARDETSK